MSSKTNSGGGAEKPTPSFRLETLKKRFEFKEAAAGARYSTPAFTMLRRPLPPSEAGQPLRFGFTVTKKVGNSVVRNRIRRRLREAVRAAAPDMPPIAMDLVILARRAALDIVFAVLVADIVRAVRVLTTKTARKPERPADKRERQEQGPEPAK